MATQEIKRRRASSRYIAICGIATLFAAGCNRTEDTTANFTKAINTYYSAHPSCLWLDPVKFPVQEDASNPKEIRGYDALVHQSLLVRASVDQKMMVASAAPVSSYDLSDKGRLTWTADPQQPGSGNFCYGHRVVASIDSASPTSSQNGATTDVVYRYSITGAPDWAKSPEVLADFPNLQADLAGTQVAHATLTDTPKGWQVTSAPWAHISDSDIYK